MKRPAIDFERLRGALRRMTRGSLLMIAERAIEIVPRAKLRALVGDMLEIEHAGEGKGGVAPLLEEVRRFHDASLRGAHYDSFDVNSKNFMTKSEGTEAFLAAFDRLLGKCVRAAAKRPRQAVRDAFELLFALWRRIDAEPDKIVFFADEGGAWQLGVDWGVVLPAYFRCLADGASGDEFARGIDRAIADFANHDRARHLAAARRVASAEQKVALRRLSTQGRSMK